MDGWFLTLALLLPGMTMALWLRLTWPEAVPGRWPLVLGYGFLLGCWGSRRCCGSRGC